jgi:hypothetical protein
VIDLEDIPFPSHTGGVTQQNGISVARNSIIRQRNPSRRHSRCRRIREAAGAVLFLICGLKFDQWISLGATAVLAARWAWAAAKELIYRETCFFLPSGRLQRRSNARR